MFISNDIRYIGVNDHQVTLFEGQYDVPLGMAYNSYVILDEKIAVMDTVVAHFGKEWLAAGLFGGAAYGAGSFRQHCGLYGRLSRRHSGGLSGGFPHDEAVLRQRLRRPPSGGGRG